MVCHCSLGVLLIKICCCDVCFVWVRQMSSLISKLMPLFINLRSSLCALITCPNAHRQSLNYRITKCALTEPLSPVARPARVEVNQSCYLSRGLSFFCPPFSLAKWQFVCVWSISPTWSYRHDRRQLPGPGAPPRSWVSRACWAMPPANSIGNVPDARYRPNLPMSCIRSPPGRRRRRASAPPISDWVL